MKIYLDNCAIQRPLDEKIQTRIMLEAEAVLGIVSFIENGEFDLVVSDTLQFEILNTPNQVRRDYALAIFAKAVDYVKLNSLIERRAKYFNEIGIQTLDALHLSTAEYAEVDFFCTCDDNIFKKAMKINDLKTKVVNPINIILEINK